VALPGKEVVVVPTSKLECFCLDLFATAGAKIRSSRKSNYLTFNRWHRNC
jgi:hypothetical protein